MDTYIHWYFILEMKNIVCTSKYYIEVKIKMLLKNECLNMNKIQNIK